MIILNEKIIFFFKSHTRRKLYENSQIKIFD